MRGSIDLDADLMCGSPRTGYLVECRRRRLALRGAELTFPQSEVMSIDYYDLTRDLGERASDINS